MKTLEEWEESGMDLDQYLGGPCEIDEGIYLHIGEVVMPKYCSDLFTQLGEAEREEDGVFFYMTTSTIDEKYFYLGVLPEFKPPIYQSPTAKMAV